MIDHRAENKALVDRFNAAVPVGRCIVYRCAGVAWDVAQTRGAALIDETDAPVVPVVPTSVSGRTVPLGFILLVVDTSDPDEALDTVWRNPGRVLELLAQAGKSAGFMGALMRREIELQCEATRKLSLPAPPSRRHSAEPHPHATGEAL